MNYEKFLPEQRLLPYVKYFYKLVSANSKSRQDHKTLRIITDGCPGIIFQSPETGHFSVDQKKLPTAFLFGQSTKHADLSLYGNFDTVGVALHPNALTEVFGLDASSYTDSCIELGSISSETRAVTDLLSEAQTIEGKVQILQTFLARSVEIYQPNSPGDMQYAMNQIMLTNGTISLKSLQETIRIPQRSFERKFKQYIGISPKLFARICSFQASLRQLNSHQFNRLSEIAYRHQYSDQSHFIRSFREFSGLSPTTYYKKTNEVIDNLSELLP
ncbi:DUF6597 domain-containing transcriptional factor [Arcticibacter sp.]|uniref:DUF6597 domain-containing transcriptional factor n=1 Tax=Arcticibacter sp. TaxID=1872630 RepID=UPI00388CED4D